MARSSSSSLVRRIPVRSPGERAVGPLAHQPLDGSHRARVGGLAQHGKAGLASLMRESLRPIRAGLKPPEHCGLDLPGAGVRVARAAHTRIQLAAVRGGAIHARSSMTPVHRGRAARRTGGTYESRQGKARFRISGQLKQATCPRGSPREFEHCSTNLRRSSHENPVHAVRRAVSLASRLPPRRNFLPSRPHLVGFRRAAPPTCSPARSRRKTQVARPGDRRREPARREWCDRGQRGGRANADGYTIGVSPSSASPWGICSWTSAPTCSRDRRAHAGRAPAHRHPRPGRLAAPQLKELMDAAKRIPARSRWAFRPRHQGRAHHPRDRAARKGRVEHRGLPGRCGVMTTCRRTHRGGKFFRRRLGEPRALRNHAPARLVRGRSLRRRATCPRSWSWATR